MTRLRYNVTHLAHDCWVAAFLGADRKRLRGRVRLERKADTFIITGGSWRGITGTERAEGL